MADQPPYDTIMKFVLTGGIPVWGQSTLGVDPADDLMRGFRPAIDSHHFSNFFEVQSFDFSMMVEPEDAATGNLSRGHPVAARGGGHPPAQGATKGGKSKAGAEAWDRWRSATADEARKMRFALTFDSFRFTRTLDGASPTFFQQCARQQSFDSATLVRRLSSGTSGKGEVGLAYMRLIFTEVMLKGVKWSDGDVVTESSEFVCNGLTFEYKRQSPDGSLHPVQGKAEWDRKKDSQRTDRGTR